MAQETPHKKVAIQCPNPVDEAARGTTKMKRTMKMSVTPHKGAAPEEHEYIREDK